MTRRLPTALAALPLVLLATPARAQLAAGGPQLYDHDGDPLVDTGPLVLAPGDLWATIQHAYSNTDGVAPYQGGLLVAQSDGLVHHIDEQTGAELAVFPVAHTADGWLGYDESRDLILTSNASIDRLRGYVPGNPVPVFDVPSPGPGPVGVAWDSLRDEYVYCDWSSDEIHVLDAGSLALVRTFAMPLTRMAGVAYDCVDDVYIVGDRDARTHSLVDPTTGAILLSFPATGTGASIPRGAASSSLDSGLWTGDWLRSDMYQLEPGHGPVQGCSGGLGTSYCVAAANSTGGGALMSAAGSTSVAANNLVLAAEPVPNQPGLFYYGPAQALQSFGDGFRCVGGTVGRLPVVPAAAGRLAHALDNTQPPNVWTVIVPGSTWYFQAWYRDPAAGGSGFNLSDGLELSFLP